jgi:hypothetical protein
MGAFDKQIVIRITGDFKVAGRGDNMAVVLDEL